MNLYDKASLILTPNAYKASKIYVAKPTDGSGDLTFSRASTAMRRNSAGLWESVANNVPRLHYPVGGGCPAWLLEPAATNKITQSVNLSLWFKTTGSLIVTGGQVSPSITDNAFKVIAAATNDKWAIYSNDVTIVSANTYSVSMFFKAGEYSKAGWRDGYTGKYVTFNVSTKTQLATNGPTVSFTDEGNGYVRAIVNYTATTVTNNNYFFILDNAYVNQNPDVYTFIGDGTSGLFMWNPQHEDGSVATSPIITAGSTVTRLDDEAFKTGASEMIGQTEGTLYIDFIGTKDISATGKFLTQILGSKNIGITTYSNVINILSGAIDASFPFTVGTRYKVAVCYRDSDNSFRIFINGAKTHDLSTYVAGTYNSFGVGCRATYGDISANTTIKDAIFYKTALSDSEAIALTTL